MNRVRFTMIQNLNREYLQNEWKKKMRMHRDYRFTTHKKRTQIVEREKKVETATKTLRGISHHLLEEVPKHAPCFAIHWNDV